MICTCEAAEAWQGGSGDDTWAQALSKEVLLVLSSPEYWGKGWMVDSLARSSPAIDVKVSMKYS